MAVKGNTKILKQPIPYFVYELAKLVDFDIEVKNTKAEMKGATKRSLSKCKIKAVGSAKRNDVLKRLITATITPYKTLKTDGKLAIEVIEKEG